METSIVKETLSDGSEVFNVVIVDGSQQIVIGAVDEAAAKRIQAVLFEDAAHACINPGGAE